ncbi:MAG: hypothetical protein AAF597_14340 [Bacteroidota bacterium]
MQHFLTITFLLFGLALSAQSYYVALVKGKVYYEEVLLKPRTKIELKGNFRFTTKDDYVKVSGPSGIHTVRPQEKEGGGYEFLRAVTQDLFPAAKPRGSFVLSAWQNIGETVSVYAENQYIPDYFVEGERLSIRGFLKPKDYENLHWVYQTKAGGYRSVPVEIVGDDIVLTPKAFQRDDTGEFDVDGTAYLFYLKNPETIQENLKIVTLNELFWGTNYDLLRGAYIPENPSADYFRMANELVTLKGLNFLQEAIGLASILQPEQVLSAEEVFGEAIQFMLNAEMTSIDNFLNDGSYENVDGYTNILREQYGEFNFNRVKDAFWDYLNARKTENPRYQAILNDYDRDLEVVKDSYYRKYTRPGEREARKRFYRMVRKGPKALPGY